MKSLKESILANMDDVINRGEEDLIKAYNIPTIKDFYKDFDYNNVVLWDCPLLFDKYKNKFKNIKLQLGRLDNLSGIQFKIYNSGTPRPFVYMYFISDGYRIVVKGWSWILNTAGLRNQKKEIIEGIKKIANPEILDEIMNHSYMCYNLKTNEYLMNNDKYTKYINKL